jgi:tRNA threonylcarbamoyl adenosine modification protein YeaZ
MKTLFLNLASHEGIIACATDAQVIASKDVDHRIGDGGLIQVLESVLADAGWTYKDLTNLACVVGPGGFTSLRVGIACANTVSQELGIPSAGIHLSDLYVRLAISDKRLASDEKLAASHLPLAALWWFHSTKKQELFVRNLKKDSESRLVHLDELPSLVGSGDQWMGELIPVQQEVVAKIGLTQAPLRPLAEILPALLLAQEYKKQILLPWYGRGW